MTEETETMTTAIERNKLSIKAEFVPFSRSRNKGDKRPSLNWKVTLLHREREIHTFDYMAGCAHCPGYKQKMDYDTKQLIAWECEKGKAGYIGANTGFIFGKAGSPIMPKIEDVVATLCLDASVIDYPNFESWASDHGYNPDSRKDEAIYRVCLETALKLRAGLGEAVLAELREAAQDY